MNASSSAGFPRGGDVRRPGLAPAYRRPLAAGRLEQRGAAGRGGRRPAAQRGGDRAERPEQHPEGRGRGAAGEQPRRVKVDLGRRQRAADADPGPPARQGRRLGPGDQGEVDPLRAQVDAALARDLGGGGVEHQRAGVEPAVLEHEVGQHAADVELLGRAAAEQRAREAQQVEAQGGDQPAVDAAALHQQRHLAVAAGQDLLHALPRPLDPGPAPGPARERAEGRGVDVQPAEQAGDRQAGQVQVEVGRGRHPARVEPRLPLEPAVAQRQHERLEPEPAGLEPDAQVEAVERQPPGPDLVRGELQVRVEPVPARRVEPVVRDHRPVARRGVLRGLGPLLAGRGLARARGRAAAEQAGQVVEVEHLRAQPARDRRPGSAQAQRQLAGDVAVAHPSLDAREAVVGAAPREVAGDLVGRQLDRRQVEQRHHRARVRALERERQVEPARGQREGEAALRPGPGLAEPGVEHQRVGALARQQHRRRPALGVDLHRLTAERARDLEPERPPLAGQDLGREVRRRQPLAQLRQPQAARRGPRT
jgi:hypothetical protein